MFLSITISSYLFHQISTYMISILSFTGLGISSKLIVSLSLSNISEKQVDAWVTDLENIFIQQGHQTPILLLHAILLSRVTQLGHAGFCHPSFRDARDRRSYEARMIFRHRTLHPGGLNVDFNYFI